MRRRRACGGKRYRYHDAKRDPSLAPVKFRNRRDVSENRNNQAAIDDAEVSCSFA